MPLFLQEKSSLVNKMRENFNQAKNDTLRDKLLDELKHQLKDEHEKLRRVKIRP